MNKFIVVSLCTILSFATYAENCSQKNMDKIIKTQQELSLLNRDVDTLYRSYGELAKIKLPHLERAKFEIKLSDENYLMAYIRQVLPSFLKEYKSIPFLKIDDKKVTLNLKTITSTEIKALFMTTELIEKDLTSFKPATPVQLASMRLFTSEIKRSSLAARIELLKKCRTTPEKIFNGPTKDYSNQYPAPQSVPFVPNGIGR